MLATAWFASGYMLGSLGNPTLPENLRFLPMALSGDNAMGADDQQERRSARASLTEIRVADSKAIPEIGFYLAGFADGEGSFNVSFRPRSDYRVPWKISLCFNISQRDVTVLRLFQEVLTCGTLRQRSDGVWYFEVNNLQDIQTKVMPFFERYRFLSVKKQRDFTKFKQIAELVANQKHLNREGTERILAIRRDMNDGGKRRYEEEEILQRFESDRILRGHTPDVREIGRRYGPDCMATCRGGKLTVTRSTNG